MPRHCLQPRRFGDRRGNYLWRLGLSGKATASLSGNVLIRSRFRFYAMACCEWSAHVRWWLSPSAAIVLSEPKRARKTRPCRRSGRIRTTRNMGAPSPNSRVIGGRGVRVEGQGCLPRTRRRSVHASRNLSRAPAASLRDRLCRPWTEPVCRQVRQQSGSGEGSGHCSGAVRASIGAAAMTRTRAPTCPAPSTTGSHAGSHTDERLPGSPDVCGQPTAKRPRSGTDVNGSGCPHRNLRIGECWGLSPCPLCAGSDREIG